MSCKPAAAALLLFLAACGRQAPPAAPRFVILRFENLGAGRSDDWMGRALSEIISAELPDSLVIPPSRLYALGRTLGVRPVSAPGVSAERPAALLSGANRIGYGDFTARGGRIEARLTIDDPQTGKATQVLTASAGDVIAVASSLARQISPRATRYETGKPEAVHRYVAAMESGNPAQMTENALAAIAADPDYALPYLLLAEARAQMRDRDGALAVIDRALARGAAIPAADRARLELQAATLRNDFAARQKALAELARANAGDAESWRGLGEMAYARHDFGQAVEAYQKALALQPDDPNALNLMGYSQAYNGDLDGAVHTFQHYRSVRPNEANPIDSLGDAYLIHGRLREAEQFYLEADKKDRKLLGAGDLLKAAWARLMTGDVPGATALAKQFADARTAMHDPAVPIFLADWAWISGHRKSAVEQLQSFARSVESGPQKELASRAYIDLAVWSLLAGDRAAAAQLSLKAAPLAGPATANAATLARFLSQPAASAAEWTARADQLFRNVPQTELKDVTLARALLLNREFAPAAAALRRFYDGPTTDPAAPVLLAWSLIETGDAAAAGPLLRFNPVPQYGGIDPFTGFYFPRLYDLRSRLGDAAARQLYQTLSAD
ncbi:MAG TPA: tetratricopeptide repeat protein [Candidatus Sulfopaludibacter sp.]|nr:tetratricopeptide repeat protein [Candidatus Sulfopaludibacter sp.]